MEARKEIDFPLLFKQRIASQYGNEAEAFLAALTQAPATSIRHHPLKSAYTPKQAIPWCWSGEFLDERPVFSLDPTFHAGAYYVQEASSMFLKYAVNQLLPRIYGSRNVLDLCAAPGGKSTLLLECLDKNDVLISNEIIANRNTILQENLVKWGYANAMVTRADPEKFGRIENIFDLICVDAPCSGEGMFRKDPNAINEWSEENLQTCSSRSSRILNDVWPALKPGGFLIYSTCTFNPDENEKLLAAFVAEHPSESIPLNETGDLGILEGKYNGIHYYQFLPHQSKGEGFFLSVIRKAGTQVMQAELGQNAIPKFAAQHAHVLNPTYHWSWAMVQDVLYARTAASQALFELLNGKIYFTKSGIEIGKIIKDELLPSHELAMLTAFEKAQYPMAEIDEKMALEYVRKGTQIKVDAPKGWVLLQHKGFVLGWIKNLGNRVNNYYPVNYRLRM